MTYACFAEQKKWSLGPGPAAGLEIGAGCWSEDSSFFPNYPLLTPKQASGPIHQLLSWSLGPGPVAGLDVGIGAGD